MKQQRHRSLQKTILAITAVFTIIIGAIIASISTYFYNFYTKRSLIQSTDANLAFLVDAIDTNISAVERLGGFCQTHSALGDYMNYKDGGNAQIALKAYDRLYEEYLLSPANPFVHRVIVGNNNGKFLMVCGSSYSTSQDVDAITRDLPQYDIQLEEQDFDFTQGYMEDPYVKRYGMRILLLIRPITYNYSFVRGGYVSISVTEDLFLSPLAYYALPEDSMLYLTLGDHVYHMTPSGLLELSEPLQLERIQDVALPDNSYASNFYDPLTGEKGYAVTQMLIKEGCTLTQVISPDELQNRARFFYMIFVICFIIIGIICTILYQILNLVINRPVIRIQNRLEKIAEGDFSRDPSIEWKHELGDIGRGINDLSERIDRLMEARIQDEKDKKDLEYKVLQNQINPHFLYNTLNSIKWMAVTQGADGISEMTTALSKLLRSISKGTKNMIPLRDELDLVRDYFTIQQYRYGSTLTLQVEVEEEALLEASINKFTLQPIVENSIFHGIEPKHSTGTISIRVYGEENTVCIAIEDDGVGMTKEQMAHLFDEKGNDPGQLFKEIGLNNIQKRIQYEFGKEYGLSVESEVNSFTRMTIRIPLRRMSDV